MPFDRKIKSQPIGQVFPCRFCLAFGCLVASTTVRSVCVQPPGVIQPCGRCLSGAVAPGLINQRGALAQLVEKSDPCVNEHENCCVLSSIYTRCSARLPRTAPREKARAPTFTPHHSSSSSGIKPAAIQEYYSAQMEGLMARSKTTPSLPSA